MSKWKSTCTCGHTMECEAETKEDAVNQFAGMMTPEAVDAHMKEKHNGEPSPAPDQVKVNLEATTIAA